MVEEGVMTGNFVMALLQVWPQLAQMIDDKGIARS